MRRLGASLCSPRLLASELRKVDERPTERASYWCCDAVGRVHEANVRVDHLGQDKPLAARTGKATRPWRADRQRAVDVAVLAGEKSPEALTGPLNVSLLAAFG